MHRFTCHKIALGYLPSFFASLMLLVLMCGCRKNVIKLTNSNPAEFSSSIASDNIYAMQTDGHGYLWIGTDRGVSIYDGVNYRNFRHDDNDTTSVRSNNVSNIYKDVDNGMWIMTEDGIDGYSGNGCFRHYRTDAALRTAGCMTQTKDGRIVALFGGELCQLEDGIFKKKCRLLGSYTDGDRTSMFQAGDGSIIVNTSAGVFIVDKDLTKYTTLPITGSVIACADKDYICLLSFNDGVYILNRSNLSVAYRTGTGMPVVAENAVLWKGYLLFSGYEGVYMMDLKSHKISAIPEDIMETIHPKFIQKLYADNNGMLWIGYNRRFKIQGINNPEDIKKQFDADKALEVFTRHGVVEVTQDDRGNVFGALDNDSLFYIEKTSGQLFATGLDKIIEIHSKQHVQAVNYSAGCFWVTTTSNVLALHYDNGFHLDEFFDIGLSSDNKCGSSVPVDFGLAVLGSNALYVFDALHKTSAVIDTRRAANSKPVTWQKGNFTVRTVRFDSGLIPLSSQLVNLGNGRILATFQDYATKEININNSKVSNSTIKLPSDIECSAVTGNHTFFGTDDGLFIYDNNSGRLNKVAEFGDKPINNISANSDGLVVTCQGDIVYFDPSTRHTEKIWQGSPENDFQPKTLTIVDCGQLFAATREGFKRYEVKKRSRNDIRPRLYLESLDAVMEGKTHRSCSLFGSDSSTTVVLSHNENTIDIKYAAITPSMSGKYTYRYRLKGYSDDWEYSDNSGAVEYAKIRPGKYIFEISCADQQRPWITVSRSLTIRLKPHPLLSQTAICIYVLLLLCGLFFANRLYIRMRMTRINADNAAKEKDREQYVNTMNMNFFANISNEFRNPITMIAGPVRLLRKAPELSKQSANMVRLISQSAKILTKLVDQMLDFNLLEGDAMRLSVNRTDVSAIISEYLHHYEVSASEKGISIKSSGTDKPAIMLADEDKVIKIFDNLMSNAVKHTPQKGTITVTMKTEGGWLTLSVENSGTHIPDKSLPSIFDRYYQTSADVADWGVGLGLHYVKSLVTLHHGNIKAANTDHGVMFTVSLPTNDNIYTTEERKPRKRQLDLSAFTDDDILRPRQQQGLAFVDTAVPDNGMAMNGETNRPALLVVEKDVNTAYFLRKLFENEYNVINRYDAESAINDIADIHPDIILSGVLLDGKSGFDLCRELHANERYKLIPFIFLTTFNSGEQQTEGIKAGADAYITKPFEPEYLREVVGKELKKSAEYKQILSMLPQKQNEPQGDELSARDKEILRVIRMFMKDNINDGDLDIDKLGRKLLLSRTKLYEKVKSLTGKTPNELFRTYKLSCAAALLKEGKLNVTEVAERSGFSSVAFFSRTFKKYFGVSPKDYA